MLTGPQHAAVEFTAISAISCNPPSTDKEYTIYGYKGKQVRDQIHCRDVASLFADVLSTPRCGEVYNLGGGRGNSLSILETINALKLMGFSLKHRVSEQHRTGDHICYISALTKVKSHFPRWTVTCDLSRILEELVAAHVSGCSVVEAG